MNYEEEEAYQSAVNEQWLKLSEAQTIEEIQEVLDTWPEKKSFEVESQSAEVDNEQNEG